MPRRGRQCKWSSAEDVGKTPEIRRSSTRHCRQSSETQLELRHRDCRKQRCVSRERVAHGRSPGAHAALGLRRELQGGLLRIGRGRRDHRLNRLAATGVVGDRAQLRREAGETDLRRWGRGTGGVARHDFRRLARDEVRPQRRRQLVDFSALEYGKIDSVDFTRHALQHPNSHPFAPQERLEAADHVPEAIHCQSSTVR